MDATLVPSLPHFHVRMGPPALPLATSTTNSSSSFPTSPQRGGGLGQARLSPRQIKLQRVVVDQQQQYQHQFPSYDPVRVHVAANFRHELFQFHQVLRDAMAQCGGREGFQDRTILELLTSDRGDAVLHEFFRQFPSKRNGNSSSMDTDVLWNVLETFFQSVPLIVTECELLGSSNAKRYALASLQTSLHRDGGDGDDHMLDAMSALLAKMGNLVRSLATLEQLRGVVDDGNDTGNGQLDVLAILKLADDLESSNDGSQVDNGDDDKAVHLAYGHRRTTLISHTRRVALLHKLKAFAANSAIDEIAQMVTTTVQVAQEQQVKQLEQLQHSHQGKQGGNDVNASGDDELSSSSLSSSSSSGDDGADDVRKMAKKSKTRRASRAAKAKARSTSTSCGSGDANDDDASVDDTPANGGHRDVLLSLRHASAQKSIKLFNVGILLRLIYQIYRENYESMVSSLQYGNRRMEFSEFLYDWHIRKYGLKTLAQQHLLKLIQSLRKHDKKVLQCQLYLRFLGIQSPLGFHEHKFVLSLLDKWSFGTFSGATKHRVVHSPRGHSFKIRIPFAISTLHDALTERLGVYFRSMDAVAARIRGLAIRGDGDGDNEFIKENDLLLVALDEWSAQKTRLEQILDAVYVAGDLNGDGGLDAAKMFAAAHDVVKPRRISFARFLDVILLEKILSTTVATTARANGANSNITSGTNSKVGGVAILGDDRGASGGVTGTGRDNGSSSGAGNSAGPSSSSAEDEEAYQFTLLQETWLHDRDVVTSALAHITHAPTAASLTFRVNFLTQILAKRVDAKTAWMCHKQIMRDINRYQNLNEAQIVVLQHKEDTFKKVVIAITNLRRLGLLGRVGNSSNANDSSASGGESGDEMGGGEALVVQEDADNGDDDLRKFTSVVEHTLEGLQRQASSSSSSIEEMLALEDELREKFLEQADEAAIDDFKNALLQIRRMSLVSMDNQQLTLEQLEALQSRSIARVDEDDDDEDDDEEDNDDDKGEEDAFG
ncbi:hypothetical protein FI667_g5572, partial [Globisporangium splendens]